MSFFSRFKKPPQPDLHVAAQGFSAVMAAQRGGLSGDDLYDMADQIAAGMLRAGRTHHEANSARWGGVTAIGQDFGLFDNFLSAHRDAAAESGVGTESKEQKLARYNVASLTFVTMVMADAPAEYERFLKFIGAGR